MSTQLCSSLKLKSWHTMTGPQINHSYTTRSVMLLCFSCPSLPCSLGARLSVQRHLINKPGHRSSPRHYCQLLPLKKTPLFRYQFAVCALLWPKNARVQHAALPCRQSADRANGMYQETLYHDFVMSECQYVDNHREYSLITERVDDGPGCSLDFLWLPRLIR